MGERQYHLYRHYNEYSVKITSVTKFAVAYDYAIFCSEEEAEAFCGPKKRCLAHQTKIRRFITQYRAYIIASGMGRKYLLFTLRNVGGQSQVASVSKRHEEGDK